MPKRNDDPRRPVLSKAQLEQIGQALYELTHARQEIDRGERIGLDLSDRRVRCDLEYERCRQIIAEYGPEQP